MPSEPKKPIEELLEASAKARRGEFGVEPAMPNPMRARLHDEIARVARKQEPKAHSSWLSIWWPRIAIGTAATALVISASVIWLERGTQQSGGTMRLATHQAEPDKAFDEIASATGNLPSTPQSGQSLDIAKSDEEKSLAMKKFAEVAIPPATPPTEVPITKGFLEADQNTVDAKRDFHEQERARVAARTEQVDQAPLAAAPSPKSEMQSTAPAAAAGPALAQNRKTQTANFKQQQFAQNVGSQAFRSNSKVKQTANVLSNFQIEQDGVQIRVVDADGSTYTGKIVPLAQTSSKQPRKENAAESASQEKQPYAARPQRALAKSAADAELAGNEFSFRATGYNSSLRKPLVFEGNYMPTPPAQQRASAAASSQSTEQLPARIVGTAKISGESPVEVDAVSVVP